MRFAQLAGAGLATLVSFASAAVVPASRISESDLNELNIRDTACTNGPYTRACWKNGYSIATDFDQKFPTTGKTVSYNLEITNTTCNPDGHGERICLLFNNQYPGPVIRAEWGDTLSITVKNSMQDNGTSIHWHGVRQYHTPGEDGVNGLSECPIAPGSTRTYTFQVTQFGSSWYHSHYSSQYGDGVIGTIIFDGPASANYDIDLGTYTVNEWYYQTAWQINSIASQNLQQQGPPPDADNLLINGTNKNADGGGSYNKVSIKSGKKYRLRLVNPSVDNAIRVSLDNHPMQVMTSDFVPVVPFYTEWILLAIGQRYDVVIHANQTAGNYWFRANAAADCLSGNKLNGLAVWTYDSVQEADPTSTSYDEPNQCVEPTNLAPYWKQPVPSVALESNLNVNLTGTQFVNEQGRTIVGWALNTSSMNIAWEKPTLSYIMEGNSSYPSNLNVIPTTNEGDWNYWLIETVQGLPPIPHPIHLHGHDFFVLGSGSGTYDPSSATLNWDTPTRRDTATMPGGGWLAIAFSSNNPGKSRLHLTRLDPHY